MICRTLAMALLAPLALIALVFAQSPISPAPAGSPSTAAEARMLIERAKQETAQEEKTWAEETAREKEAEVRRKQRFADFTQDRLRLQQTLAEQEQKLKATLAKMEGHQFRERELTARFKQLGNVLSAKAKELRPALAAGLPFRLDKRLEALDLLVRDLEGGTISPEEAMNRLWTLEQNERRLAQEAEIFTGDFSEDAGDPVQVKYLRVGKQLMAFSSLDGTRLGIMRQSPDTAGPNYVWVREKDMDRETRQALKHAMATAEGKSVPGFVPVPVWKNAFAETVAMNAPAAEAAAAPAVAPKSRPAAKAAPVVPAAPAAAVKGAAQ